MCPAQARACASDGGELGGEHPRIEDVPKLARFAEVWRAASEVERREYAGAWRAVLERLEPAKRDAIIECLRWMLAAVLVLVLAVLPGCGARVQLRSVLSAAVTPDGAIWYVMTEDGNGGASSIFRCIGDDPEQSAEAECSRVRVRE